MVKRKNLLFIGVIILMFSITSGCGGDEEPTEEPVEEGRCGNGTCEGGENPSNCPADCPLVCDHLAGNRAACEASGGFWVSEEYVDTPYCNCCITYTTYETCSAHPEYCTWDRVSSICSHK